MMKNVVVGLPPTIGNLEFTGILRSMLGKKGLHA
jgi:hypothetical protein